MKHRKGVLQGHKRVKSRFVPPLMQLPNLRETSYVNDLLPHVLWMSLLNDAVGLKQGIHASFELAKLARSIHVSEKHVNFAVCGNFNNLSPSENEMLLEELRRRGTLNQYQDALSPLLSLHPNCPMRALATPHESDQHPKLVARLRISVANVFDRYSTSASIMHANVITIRASTGGLFFAKHIEMPDFDSLVHSPDSEKAKRAASFARSSSMQEFMSDAEGRHLEWSKLFWNTNYRLDACIPMEFPDE